MGPRHSCATPPIAPAEFMPMHPHGWIGNNVLTVLAYQSGFHCDVERQCSGLARTARKEGSDEKGGSKG